MRIANLVIHSIESQLFAENCYIINCDGQTGCVVIDPGFQHEELIQHIKNEGLQPLAILNTHGHSDHIAGNDALKQVWPSAPLVIGKGDAYKLTDPEANLSAPFGASLLSPPADEVLEEGDVAEFAGMTFEILETPGHSKGHIVFVYRSEPCLIFGGDVLFHGNVGRTDFFDGSFQELESSIQQKLFRFPHETIVFPGHGPPTQIGHEIENNPVVGIPAGYKPE